MRQAAILILMALSTPVTAFTQLRFEFLPAGEVRPEGWIQRQMQLDLAEGLTGSYHQVSNAVNLNVFQKQDRPAGGFVEIPGEKRQKSWWSGEHEGYWKDSIVRMAFLVDDERQKRRASQWMQELLAAQDEEGYIGVYSRETRFPKDGENGELWTQSRIFQAMLAYYEFTGDKDVLRAIEKAAQLTLERYRDTTYFGAANGAGGLSHGVGFMDTLEWLYRLTKKSVYRDGAVWLYRDYQKLTSRDQEMQLERLLDINRAWQGHTPHIMEGLHMPAILFALTGDSTYQRAATNALLKYDRHANPGGGVVGDEQVDNRPGSADLPAEYCTMTEGVTSLNRILAWQGELSAGHRVERVCLNAAQGARFQPVNMAVRYLTQDNQLRADEHRHAQRFLYAAWHDAAACCTLNSGRLMPYYVEGMWYRNSRHDALLANLYGPGRVDTRISDASVRIHEKTYFPFSDKLELDIECERPTRFSLVLRIPPGSGQIGIEAGDAAQIECSPDRIEITKTWASSDGLNLDFDFQLALLQDRNGEFYYRWGPLLFSLPLPDRRNTIKEFAALSGKPSGYQMWEILPTDERPWSYRFVPDAKFSVVTLAEGNMETPWANPPIGLRGTMLDEDDRPVEVTLRPLGSALLRRTTFPMAGASK